MILASEVLIKHLKFAISNLRSRRIFTLISWGTIRFLRGTICLAKSCMFLNPWNHCTSHSFAKILNVRFRLANCSISIFNHLQTLASIEKWLSRREAAIWQSIFLPSFFCASKKSVAVQHAMLVGFLALLCPHKEVQAKENKIVHQTAIYHKKLAAPQKAAQPV